MCDTKQAHASIAKWKTVACSSPWTNVEVKERYPGVFVVVLMAQAAIRHLPAPITAPPEWQQFSKCPHLSTAPKRSHAGPGGRRKSIVTISHCNDRSNDRFYVKFIPLTATSRQYRRFS